MGKVFKILFNILLILIIILLVGYCVLRFTDRVRIYSVETGSMEDKIHTGDYILLVKKDNYYVGDVVTYQIDGYFITHRIIKIENGVITTKGDANNKEDKEITNDIIEGKVIYCGGVLNFIIEYKFVIAAFLVGLYLLSCYFGDDKKEDEVIFEEELPNNDGVTKETSKESNDKKETEEVIIEELPNSEEVVKEEVIIEEELPSDDKVIEETSEERNDEKEIKEEVIEKPKRTRKSKKDEITKEVQKEKPKKTKVTKETNKEKEIIEEIKKPKRNRKTSKK